MYSIENPDMYTFDKEPERSLNFADLVTEDIKIKMLQIVIEDHSKVSILTKILEVPFSTGTLDLCRRCLPSRESRTQTNARRSRLWKVKDYLA